MNKEFALTIKRSDSRKGKNCKIHRSYWTIDYYRNYKKNGGRLTDSEFRKVIQEINLILKDNFLNGKDVIFPYGLGRLELRKKENKVSIVDGKLKTNRPIDWNETLKLWEVDEEARENKTLVRCEEKYQYAIRYSCVGNDFIHKKVMRFTPARDLKNKLVQNILNKKVDAFTFD